MEKRLDYFYYAEEDYKVIKIIVEQGIISNVITYTSQLICERYLKHIMDINMFDKNNIKEFKTHNLKSLKRFIVSNIKDFKCDWNKVVIIDGVYYDTRYPGENSYTAKEEDVIDCWSAVVETRESVLNYLKTFNKPYIDNIELDIYDVINKLKDESNKLI